MMRRQPFKLVLSLALVILAGTPNLSIAASDSGNYLYERRQGLEMANGFSTYSETRRSRVMRIKRGDQSMIVSNVLDGAAVVETIDMSRAMPLRSANSRIVESAFRYDYNAQTLHGLERFAGYFNRYIRPHLSKGLATRDATWTKSIRLRDLGFTALGRAQAALTIERRFVTHKGRRYALTRFDAEPFRYRTPLREPVVHWARGIAISSADFGITYYMGVRHRAVGGGAGKDQRPMSWKSYSYATDQNGHALLRLADFPEARQLMQRAEQGFTDATPIRLRKPRDADLPVIRDRTFQRISGVLTPFAFALAENAANDIPVTSGMGTFGEALSDAAMLQTLTKLTKQMPVFKQVNDIEYFINQLDADTPSANNYQNALAENEKFKNANNYYELKKEAQVAMDNFNNVPGKDRYSEIMREYVRLNNSGNTRAAEEFLDKSQPFITQFLSDMDKAAVELDKFQSVLADIERGLPNDADALRKLENAFLRESSGLTDEALALMRNNSRYKFNDFLDDLGVIGTGLNASDAFVKVLESTLGNGFVGVDGATYDEQAQDFLDGNGLGCSSSSWILAFPPVRRTLSTLPCPASGSSQSRLVTSGRDTLAGQTRSTTLLPPRQTRVI